MSRPARSRSRSQSRSASRASSSSSRSRSRSNSRSRSPSPPVIVSSSADSRYLTSHDLFSLPPLPSDSASRPANAATSASVPSSSSVSLRPRRHVLVTGSSVDRTDIFCLSYSPDGRYLAAGCGDGSIRVFLARSLELQYCLNPPRSLGTDSMPITCIRFRPPLADSRLKYVLIASSASGSLSHWHLSSESCIFTLDEPDNQLYTCCYDRIGQRFVTGGRDAKLRIYEENTKQLISTLGTPGKSGHSSRIYAAKFHPTEENVLLSGGWDNTIQIFDTRSGSAVRSIFGPHICGDALDISADGRCLVSGSWRASEALQLWDFGSGALLSTIEFTPNANRSQTGKAEMLYTALFSPDNESSLIAAGGCGTNEAKLFDRKSGREIEQISLGEGGCYCTAFDPTAQTLAVAGGGGTITAVTI